MSAFLVTVNPAKWTDPEQRDFVEDQIARFRLGRPLAASSWLTSRKAYVVGDRVYLLLQGSGSRGIIASGVVADDRVSEESHFAGESRRASYVFVERDAFIEEAEALATDRLEQLAPSTRWNPRSSGTKVAPADETDVEAAWIEHLDRLELGMLSGGDGGATTSAEIEASYARAERKVRRHQRAFRHLLMDVYPVECAYCGLDVVHVLDAAHLTPDSVGGLPSASNGRLLCANHHRAFDAGLLRWSQARFVPVKGAATVPPTPPP